MEHSPLNPKNISKYLESRKDTKSAYQIFHIDYTAEEKEALKNFNVTKMDTFKYCGNKKKPEVKEFLESLGDNSKKEIDNIINIVYKLIDNILDGYKKEYYWISIRIVDFTHGFDIPRWHRDGSFFDIDKLNQSKFVTVIKGPGTLLKENTIENKKIYDEINTKRRAELNSQKNQEEFKIIDNKYREKFADALKESETKQINNDEGLIFFVGDENSAIHSEPKMDSQRMFISILPGDEDDIMKLSQCRKQNGGYYDKLIKYQNKLKFKF
jgi:hypothetical protein